MLIFSRLDSSQWEKESPGRALSMQVRFASLAENVQPDQRSQTFLILEIL